MAAPGRRRWPRILAEAALVAALVVGLYAWQTRGLLPDDRRLAAPGLALPDLDGRPQDLATLAGRPVVVYFFAPWCKVCAASAHQLRWFRQAAGDSADLVFVALDWESPGQVRDYAARHGLDAPVLLGDAATARAWQVRGYPTYYVIDSGGRVAASDLGLSTAVGLWLRTRGL